MIETPCGFDDKFFELLKVFFDKKSDVQKHGVLLLDEISLRESISVNSATLTYTGLVDFGPDGKQSADVGEKANHGLVIMFQPLADGYSQPIGVFASKGPVKGDVLATLILTVCILFLYFFNVNIIWIFTIFLSKTTIEEYMFCSEILHYSYLSCIINHSLIQ